MQERRLETAQAEKDNLQSSVNDLSKLNHDLSLEIGDSKSVMSNHSMEWNGEKERLMNRLTESNRTLVMATNQNDNLVKQKAELANNRKDLEKREVPPRPPPKPQPDLPSELTRLQMNFLKEKKETMNRQNGLEDMLRDAPEGETEDDKENTKKATPKRSIKGLALENMKKSRAPRPPSRPKQPLSPTGTLSPRQCQGPLSPTRSASPMMSSSAMMRSLAGSLRTEKNMEVPPSPRSSSMVRSSSAIRSSSAMRRRIAVEIHSGPPEINKMRSSSPMRSASEMKRRIAIDPE